MSAKKFHVLVYNLLFEKLGTKHLSDFGMEDF